MGNPTVSIIVPVYNTEAYLPQCLDSLISQTLQNVEIICVDDASTDESLAILNKYAIKDDRIKVISLPCNKRQGGARNVGIREASGKYIGFVDSDDWVDRKMYETLYYQAIEANADICVSDYFIAFPERNYLKEVKSVYVWKDLDLVTRKKQILIKGERLWTSIIRRSLIVEHQLFFPENVAYEDNAVEGIFAVANQVVGIEKCFYYYRQHAYSTTHRKNDSHYFDRLKTAVIFLENMKRLGIYEIYKEESDYRFYSFYYINSVFGCINLFSPPAIKEIAFLNESVNTYVNIESNKYYKQLPLVVRAFLYILKINVKLGVNLFLILKKFRRLNK